MHLYSGETFVNKIINRLCIHITKKIYEWTKYLINLDQQNLHCNLVNKTDNKQTQHCQKQVPKCNPEFTGVKLIYGFVFYIWIKYHTHLTHSHLKMWNKAKNELTCDSCYSSYSYCATLNYDTNIIQYEPHFTTIF